MEYTGWMDMEGDRYYFLPAAAAGLNKLRDYDSGDTFYFYFNDEFIMESDLLYTDPESGDIYYFDRDGRSQKSGWVTNGGYTYYFSSFKALRDCTKKLEKDGKTEEFTFDKKGRLQPNRPGTAGQGAFFPVHLLQEGIQHLTGIIAGGVAAILVFLNPVLHLDQPGQDAGTQCLFSARHSI